MSSAFSTASSGGVGQLHAAGLAAAAGLHLGLDDDGLPMPLGDAARLLGGVDGLAGEHGHAVLGEELLRLVLMRSTGGPVSRGSCGPGQWARPRSPATPRAAPQPAAPPRCHALRAGDVGAAQSARRARGPSRRSTAVVAPGVKTLATPSAVELGDVVLGDDPAAEHDDVVGAALAQQLDHAARTASCARRTARTGRRRRRPPGSPSRRSARASGAGRCRRPPCRRRAAPARRPWRRGRARPGRAWRRPRAHVRRAGQRWSRGPPGTGRDGGRRVRAPLPTADRSRDPAHPLSTDRSCVV